MENIRLWENEIPFYNEKFQIEYNENTASIDAYTIKDGKKHSAVVICPGGGYNHRAVHEGKNVALWLNSCSINAFVVNYRVYPYKHPAGLSDAKRAVRYVRKNAEKFGIFDDKIGIMGFSAGAHLAGCVAQHYNEFEYYCDETDNISARPDMLCLCYPVVSLCEDYAHKGSGENLLDGNSDLSYKLSLEKNVSCDMPPTFIWHTFEDKSVSVINSLEMAESLKEKNIPFELHIFPQGRHGLGMAENINGARQWRSLFLNWLDIIGFIKK